MLLTTSPLLARTCGRLFMIDITLQKGGYAPHYIRLELLPKRMCLTMMMQE
jgi:hypothetical protein